MPIYQDPDGMKLKRLSSSRGSRAEDSNKKVDIEDDGRLVENRVDGDWRE